MVNEESCHESIMGRMRVSLDYLGYRGFYDEITAYSLSDYISMAAAAGMEPEIISNVIKKYSKLKNKKIDFAVESFFVGHRPHQRIIIDGIIYDSQKQASDITGMSVRQIQYAVGTGKIKRA